jgi:hypothetical protein
MERSTRITESACHFWGAFVFTVATCTGGVATICAAIWASVPVVAWGAGSWLPSPSPSMSFET